MKAEDFFPMGWRDKPFRRPPNPNLTYEEALDTAASILWNIGTEEAQETSRALGVMQLRMVVHHAQFEGRSMQSVAELSELWRGKVTTLLKTLEGTK